MAPIRLKDAGENRIAYLGLAFTFFFLSWYTWGHWGNLRVDMGRELYVPSSLLNGKLLYRDLWYPYGPLTPYLQALLYRLFGLHWNVLYLFGLATTLSCTFLLFTISRRFVSPTAAFLVPFCFLMQGFHPHLFNYIVPYAYAATLGSLLGLACLYFVVRTTLNESGPNLSLAGFAAGLALLCKQEFGFSCYLLMAFVLTVRVLMQRSLRTLASDLLACVPGVLLNVCVYGWFIWQLSPRFVLLENFQVTAGSYFMRTFGEHWLTVWGLRFIPSEMVKTAAIGIFALAAWFIMAFALRNALRYRFVLPCAATVFGVVLAGYLLNFPPALYLTERWPLVIFPKGMFWLACLLLVWELTLLFRNGSENGHMALAAVAVYAVATGIRIMVQVEPYGYAIFYNSTLFLAFVVLLCRVIEAALPLEIRLRQALINGLLLMEVMGLALLLFPQPQRLPAPLTTSLGTIYTREVEATLFPQIISFMKQQKASGKHVLVLPDDASLYCFSDAEAPTRWYVLIPGVISPTQEEEYISQAERYGVDYILLSNRNTAVYGMPYFGIHYNQKIYRWMQTHYKVVGEFGIFERQPNSPFAMLIYKRHAASTIER
jgi:hypothetical protein